VTSLVIVTGFKAAEDRDIANPDAVVSAAMPSTDTISTNEGHDQLVTLRITRCGGVGSDDVARC
jgi:hypothetical protein